MFLRSAVSEGKGTPFGNLRIVFLRRPIEARKSKSCGPRVDPGIEGKVPSKAAADALQIWR
jgi:hypothetical protein